MTDTDREAFEAWLKDDYYDGCDDGGGFNEERRCYNDLGAHMAWLSWQAATQRQQSRIAELEDAARINSENYEFQRNKADKATATVYQFHYAMKDAGWHPGRTDDNLCDIIRAKGKALAELEAEVQALRKDAERYQKLRSADCDEGVAPMEHRVNDWGKWYWAPVLGQELDDTLDAAPAIEAERGEG